MLRRWLAGALAAAMVCTGCAKKAAAETLTPGTVYLRVIARDDSDAAQAEKLRARDAVLAACPAYCADPRVLLPLLQRALRPFAPCRAEIRAWSPGGGAAPALTVYITLGPGNGRNWWSVLYRDAVKWVQAEKEPADHAPDPPCADGPAADGGVEVVWPLLAWLWGLLGL